MTKKMALAVTAASMLAVGAALPAVGSTLPADSGENQTFEEFAAATFQDVDGAFVVNGDEPVADLDGLREFYEDMHSHEAHDDILIVNTVRGADDVWSQQQVGDLSYCISTSFGSRHADMVAAMEDATAQWEEASPAIDFVYDSSQDRNCVTSNNTVLFPVQPVSGVSYIARAFFPSSPDSQRNVLVAPSIWTSGSWSAANVMAHELGHVLGFRHEHTRPQAGTCYEDSNWRPLTPYDSSSIMHYPQCNGSSDDLSMTELDREGAALTYGY